MRGRRWMEKSLIRVINVVLPLPLLRIKCMELKGENMNNSIKGWTEMLQLMVEGDKVEIYAPPKLGTHMLLQLLHAAYGVRGMPPRIPGNSILIFQIELVTIRGKKVPKHDL